MWQKPRNFYWVLDGRLAGMPRPASPADYDYLKEAGVGLIVTLTESPLHDAVMSEYGFEYLHVPIPDFTAPSPEQVDSCMEAVDYTIRRGHAVVLHCFAGRGRTGTMAACYLVRKGSEPDQAIGKVRRLMPGSIETAEQEQAVRDYARRLDST